MQRKCYLTENVVWEDVIPRIEMSLRATKQSTTHRSPFEIEFGRSMILPLDRRQRVITSRTINLENERVHLKNQRHKFKEKQEKYNKKYTKYTEPLKTGEKVMIRLNRPYGKKKFEGPYLVTLCLGKWKYRLKHIITNEEKVRNYNQLKVLRHSKPRLAKSEFNRKIFGGGM